MRTRAHPLWYEWNRVLVLAVLGLVGCASEVVRRPTQFTPVPGESGATIEVLVDLSLSVGPGYSRGIPRGGSWSAGSFRNWWTGRRRKAR